MARTVKPALRRVVIGGGALMVLAFAIEGGEFGTTDLISQRSRKRALARDIDSLRTAVDSLSALRKAILTDRAVQERIAREEFGMVRGDKEILYRFAEPVGGSRDSAGGRDR